jgi:hypothetical protein
MKVGCGVVWCGVVWCDVMMSHHDVYVCVGGGVFCVSVSLLTQNPIIEVVPLSFLPLTNSSTCDV